MFQLFQRKVPRTFVTHPKLRSRLNFKFVKRNFNTKIIILVQQGQFTQYCD